MPHIPTDAQHTLQKAAFFAYASDAATIAHGLAALPVAHHILTHEQPSWREWAMHASASSLDLVDGSAKDRAVRMASKILLGTERNLRDPEQRPTREEYALLSEYGIIDRPGWDEKVDKGYFYIVTAALAARALKQGHTVTALGLGTNLAIAATRDELKRLERKEASKHHISVHATRSGKDKTKWQGVSVGILTSPIGRFAAGRALGVGLLTYSTGLGIHDFRAYRRFVRHEKARKGELATSLL